MASMKYLGKPCATLEEVREAYREMDWFLINGWQKLSKSERIKFIKYCRRGVLDAWEKEDSWELMATDRLSVFQGSGSQTGQSGYDLWVSKSRNWWLSGLFKISLGLKEVERELSL